MAESNATQVILTDDGLKIIKVQNTADEAVGNVNDINSDNKLTPSEKIKLKQEYDKDSKLYAIDISQLQSVGLPTTELETAMSNLTNFVTPLFEEMYITSTVDRDALDSVFTAFAMADKNASQAFVNMVQQVADDAKKAGDDAKEVGTKAQEAGEAAKASAEQAKTDATQAKADALTAQQKAQSSIDQLSEASTKFDGEITEAKKSASQAQSSADNAFSRAQAIGRQASSAISVQSAATAKAQSSANNALSSASSAVAKAESTASEFGKVSQKADSAFDNALSAQSDASAAVAQASSAATDSKDAKQIAGAVSQSYKTLTDGSTMTIAELQNGLAAKLTKTDLNGYATQDWAQNQIKTTADGINGTISSVKSTVDGHTTSINTLQADSNGFKAQFDTVNGTLGKHTTDIGTLQASSKELSSNFSSLTTDNNTNKNDISQLQQTAKTFNSTLTTVQTQVQNSAVGTNLAIGTGQEYLMGFGIPNTVWQDGYAYEKLPLSTTAGEILPKDPNSFHYTLTKGTTYTQTVWIETDATVKNLSAAKITWFTNSHDYQPATVVNLGGNKYKVYSTYTWPGKSDNNVRLFDIGSLASAFDLSTGTYLKFGKLKLEKGSLSTDWCPNPADTATKSQITQLSGEIAQKVSSSDFSTYKTQTANLIGSKVSSNDFNSYKTQTDKAIESKVANNDFSSYKTETAQLIGSKVSSSDFSTYKTQTADLIASKVATKDFSAYQATTAKSIDSKVESKDFNTYKTQTDSAISSKVESSDFQALKTQANNSAVGTNLLTNLSSNWTQGWTGSSVGIPPTFYSSNSRIRTLQTIPVSSNSPYTISISDTSFRFSWSELDSNGNKAYQAPWITSANYTFTTTSTTTQLYVVVAYKTDAVLDTSNLPKIKLEKGSLSTDWCPNPADTATKSQITQLSGEIDQKVDSGDFSSYKTQTDRLIADKVDNGDFSSYKTETARLIGSKVSSSDFSTYKTQTADLISSKVANGDFSTYKAQTAQLIGSKVESKDFNSYKAQTDKAIISKVESSNFQSLQNQVQNSAVGTNLIVLSGLKYGYLDRNSGGINGGGGDFYSDNYIATNGATVFTFSSPDYVFKGSGNHTLAMYDSDKNYLGYQYITSATQTLSKSNVAYIRFSMNFTNEGGTSGNLSDWLDSHRYKLEKGSVATDYSVSPEDQATKSQITQLSGEIAQKVDSAYFSSYKTQTANLIGSKVANSDFSTYKTQTDKLIGSKVDNGTYQSYKTQTAELISQAVKKNDVVNQINISNEGILIDGKKVHITGNTSIDNAVIKNSMIANAAINTAQIADGAINNAKIANAAINDAKISNLNGNKIIAGSITSKQLNANDIIANVINGKTINGITMNTPKLNLGTNGILTEDWNLIQNTAWFQPKKGVGTTTLDMGVLRMSGNLSRWWGGNGSDQYWYGIGDNGDRIKNGSNSVTDDYAPGYEKHDIVGSSGVLLRSYLDATGLYLNQNSTKTVMVALTQKGLDTGGYIHAQQNSVVDKWFDAGVNTGTGIRIGYRAIQAHGSNDIYFNTDSTVGALTLHAKKFAASSQLSRKKDISPLEEEQAMETIMNTDIYRYHYKDETESEPYNYSVIIDDVHEKPQYKTPEEFIIADRTGRNDGNAVGFLIQALKNANRRISALEEIINERK